MHRENRHRFPSPVPSFRVHKSLKTSDIQGSSKPRKSFRRVNIMFRLCDLGIDSGLPQLVPGTISAILSSVILMIPVQNATVPTTPVQITLVSITLVLIMTVQTVAMLLAPVPTSVRFHHMVLTPWLLSTSLPTLTSTHSTLKTYLTTKDLSTSLVPESSIALFTNPGTLSFMRTIKSSHSSTSKHSNMTSSTIP